MLCEVVFSPSQQTTKQLLSGLGDKGLSTTNGYTSHEHANKSTTPVEGYPLYPAHLIRLAPKLQATAQYLRSFQRVAIPSSYPCFLAARCCPKQEIWRQLREYGTVLEGIDGKPMWRWADIGGQAALPVLGAKSKCVCVNVEGRY